MMSKPILAICVAMAAVAAGTSIVSAQGYPPPPGPVYSQPPGGYPPGSYPPGAYLPDSRRGPGTADFDALEDDEAPNAQRSAALPPPGPTISPDDPRYGRPMSAAPVYSDRGPVVSPDDPRYGRPMGAAPVYSDRGPVVSPDDPRYGRPMVRHLSIRTAARSFRPMTLVMAVRRDRRR